MESTLGKLTARKVKTAKPGTYVDGKGLLLRVRSDSAASWILRVQFNGRRRDIGLGSTDVLTLAEARERAAQLRKVALLGGDPVAERDKAKARAVTFAEAVRLAHAELGQGWADKTAAQFLSAMNSHAVPVLGPRNVNSIEAAHVKDMLLPIWSAKPQAARKVRHWTLQVLDFAKASGWRSEPAPLAREIAKGLAKQPESDGFSAVPWKEVPAYYVAERARRVSPARLALLFTILTAARSGEVRRAEWSQIDLEGALWHRPAEIMKAGKAHSVPLSQAAAELLRIAGEQWGTGGLVFPSARLTSLSDAALGKILRTGGRSETVHGFRSSFRDWAADMMPDVPFAVPELCLAHAVGSAVEKAYLRSDLIDQRRALMGAWADFVTGARVYG